MAIEERIPVGKTNRCFSRLLRGVREGRSVVITACGRRIARLVTISGAEYGNDRIREAAKRELLRRLQSQPVIDIGRWTRDELYDQ